MQQQQYLVLTATSLLSSQHTHSSTHAYIASYSIVSICTTWVLLQTQMLSRSRHVAQYLYLESLESLRPLYTLILDTYTTVQYLCIDVHYVYTHPLEYLAHVCTSVHCITASPVYRDMYLVQVLYLYPVAVSHESSTHCIKHISALDLYIYIDILDVSIQIDAIYCMYHTSHLFPYSDMYPYPHITHNECILNTLSTLRSLPSIQILISMRSLSHYQRSSYLDSYLDQIHTSLLLSVYVYQYSSSYIQYLDIPENPVLLYIYQRCSAYLPSHP